MISWHLAEFWPIVMAKKKKSSNAKTLTSSDHDYGASVNSMVDLLESARRASARAVNSVMTATYWEIGRRMVEWEQHGRGRAEYGEEVVKQLALDLTKQFGRGFSWRNLYQMRRFFEAYPDILQTASAKSADDGGQPHSFPIRS